MDDINQLQEQLGAHRATLAHLLHQRAYFDAGLVPTHLAHGIAEARAAVVRLKTQLRDRAVLVDDQPNDHPEPGYHLSPPASWRSGDRSATLAPGLPTWSDDGRRQPSWNDAQLLIRFPEPSAGYHTFSTLPHGAERAQPWHNLPQRTYSQFIGREAELHKLTQLLSPHPRSRHFVVTLDGIGGVGKSALALEIAHSYRERYATLPPDERFAALIWVSAKRTLLTADGIQQRRQQFNTLDDLYHAIATVLEQPAILHADAAQRRNLVEHALAAQRTLLLIDNLETVDDEALLTFLRELPDPTKAIVTTRHRIDIAYAIRLTGMPREDALQLMTVEASAKVVLLAPDAQDELYHRTGGVPLAMVWSIGLMSVGHSVNAVVRRLGNGHSDIAHFCFTESFQRIRGHNAERLLFALALFEHSVSRDMLGDVAGLSDDLIGCDDGIAELIRLSLINQEAERVTLLPLTQSFVVDERARQPVLDQEVRDRWIATLVQFAQPYHTLHHFQPNLTALIREGPHLLQLADWLREHQRRDQFLAVLPAVLYYTDTIGAWDALLDYCQQGIEDAHLIGDAQAQPRLYCTLAWVYGQQGHHTEAIQALNTALAIAHRLKDSAWVVETLGRLSQAFRRSGDISQAEACCTQAVLLINDLPAAQQPYTRADIDFEMGKIARDAGDWIRARTCFMRARHMFSVDEAHPSFNIERAWGILGNLALVDAQLGNHDEAAAIYAQCLAFFRQWGGRAYTTTLLVRMATLEITRGNREMALEHAHEALDLSTKLTLVQERAQATALITQLTTPQGSEDTNG